MINIDKPDKERYKMSGYDVVTYILKRNFSILSVNFLKYKKGHVDQHSVFIVENLASYVECDHDYLIAQFVKFTTERQDILNIDDLKAAAGCERNPYIMTYTLRPRNGLLYFKAALFQRAEDDIVIPAGPPISKIKTIDKHWIYAANYNAHSSDSLVR